MILGQMYEELNSGFVASSFMLITGAMENMIGVFFPSAAMEALSVNTVILGGMKM
jgi:hypothetical protein